MSIKPKPILFVSHCILNKASKVQRIEATTATKEEAARQALLRHADAHDIALIQLPCPELLQFGLRRWGHSREQFDNSIYRAQCRRMLDVILLQMNAYVEDSEQRFQILGVVGIEGSPSCAVNHSYSAPWGGGISGLITQDEKISSGEYLAQRGIFMDVLHECLADARIDIPFLPLDASLPDKLTAAMR